MHHYPDINLSGSCKLNSIIVAKYFNHSTIEPLSHLSYNLNKYPAVLFRSSLPPQSDSTYSIRIFFQLSHLYSNMVSIGPLKYP